MAKAKVKGVNIALPEDFVIVESFDKPQGRKITSDIPDGWEGVDIGPKSREKFKEILKTAKTVVWNGPMGVFEIDAFAEGTKEVAKCLAGLKGATTIIGGGDSAAAVSKFGFEKGMTHISTGGGLRWSSLRGKNCLASWH